MKICKYKIKQYCIFYNFIFFKLKYGNNINQIQDTVEYTAAVFIIAFGAKSVSSVFAIDHNIFIISTQEEERNKILKAATRRPGDDGASR